MLFKTTAVLSTLALLFAGQALGSPEANGALIATDPKSACGCPRNCNHKAGSSCKFYAGNSDKSTVVSGKCGKRRDGLVCIP
ncbi:hypothetical protein V2G26_018737 [Clonostachys chloroleuca]